MAPERSTAKIPTRYRNRIRHSTDGIILRIEEKRRILLDNIYGVDLDQNAVEVSKLSLLLKMLENEHDTARHRRAAAARFERQH